MQTVIANFEGPDHSVFCLFEDSNSGHIGVRHENVRGDALPNPIFSHHLAEVDRRAFATLIKSFPGLVISGLDVADRTTKSIFDSIMLLMECFKGGDGWFSSELVRRNDTPVSVRIMDAYGMVHVDYTAETDPQPDDNDQTEAIRFGGGWIVRPLKKVGNMVAIFTYDRLETDDFACQPSDLVARQEAIGNNSQYRDQKIITRMTDEYIIAHDHNHNYFRVWDDGKFELLSTLEALSG